MDPATIAMLVQTLGPVVIPALANVMTWLFNKALGAMSPAHQTIVQPFLPVLAGAVGTALSLQSGGTGLQGFIAGLSATGGHQMVHQIVKAAKAKPATQAPPPPPKPA